MEQYETRSGSLDRVEHAVPVYPAGDDAGRHR
jgi:hypothetical protein